MRLTKIEDLTKKIEDIAGMTKEAKDKATAMSSNKLKLMSPMSAEATVVRNYIDYPGRIALEETLKDT